MLNNLFQEILNISIIASYITIVIVLIRFFLKSTPKKFSYILWLILLFRLINPIPIYSEFSFEKLINSLTNSNNTAIQTIFNTTNTLESSTISLENPTQNSSNTETLSNILTNSYSSHNYLYIGTLIWIIGVFIFVIYSLILYIKLNNNIRYATLCNEQYFEDNKLKVGISKKVKLYESSLIQSPFVYGIINPRIYIPTNISANELSYILMHELVHIKRHDNIIKPISYIILVFHWFNPLMWLSFNLMNKDMEMSCDEKVMDCFGEEIKFDYSNSLLTLATTNKSLIYATPLSFGESNIKTRIKNVLNSKSPSKLIVFLIIILIGLSTIILSTTLPKNESMNNKVSTNNDNNSTLVTSIEKNISKESDPVVKDINNDLETIINILNDNKTVSPPTNIESTPTETTSTTDNNNSKNTKQSTSTIKYSTLKLKSPEHEEIKYLQSLLLSLGYDLGSEGANKDGVDGYFGSKTLTAVKLFQKDFYLEVTGEVDKSTWYKLEQVYQIKKLIKEGFPILKYKSPDKKNVTLLQSILIYLDYDLGNHGIDGVFGKDTLAAVKKFQEQYNLKVDGIVGKETWNKLTEGYFMSR